MSCFLGRFDRPVSRQLCWTLPQVALGTDRCELGGSVPTGGTHACRLIPSSRKRKKFAGPTIACLLSGVCLDACTAPVALPPVERVSSPVAGEPDALPPYYLQVGDVLDLKFPLNPELNDEVTIRPDGMISTGYATDIPAYGHTVSQLTEELKTSYRKDLTDPHLSVIVRTFAPNRVYVAGEVNAPGEFITAGPNLTLSQAITRAGGVKFSANREKVFVLRRGPHDVPQAFMTDYFGVITGQDPQGDVRLAQYDVVYVSRTGIGDAYQVANQYVLQFVPVSAAITATGVVP